MCVSERESVCVRACMLECALWDPRQKECVCVSLFSNSACMCVYGHVRSDKETSLYEA